MTCFEKPVPLALAAILCGPQGASDMTSRSPGRPKDLEKREAILDAAQKLFAEKGLQGAPIEAIAAESGVSKVTVYAHFGDKTAMLEAIVAREADRLSHELTAETGGEGRLEDRLVRFGQTLVRILGEPCHQALDRALSLEAHRNSDVARRFFEAGPGRVRRLLASVLAEAMAKGEISASDPMQAAEDLMSLWLGFSMMQRRFVECSTANAEDDEVAARRAVQLFLRGSASVPA